MFIRYFAVLFGFALICTASKVIAQQNDQVADQAVGQSNSSYITGESSDTIFSSISRVIDIDEIVITGTRTPRKLSQSPVITQVIKGSKIEERGISDIRSLLEQEIPGLLFNEVGFGTSINMQGLTGKHILFLIDGERMAGETGDNIDYNRLNMNDVERIEIVQGASSAIYGSQAMGGVINVITKKSTRPFYIDVSARWSPLYERNFTDIQKNDRYKFFKKSVDALNLNSDLTIGRNWKKWTSKSVFTFKSLDGYRLFNRDSITKIFPEYDLVIHEPRDRTPTQVAGLLSYDFNQTLEFKPSDKFTLTAKGNYYSMRKYDLNPDNKHEFNIDLAGTIKGNYHFNENSNLEVSLYSDNYDKNNRLELLEMRKDLIYRHQLLQPRVFYNGLLFKNHLLSAGMEYLAENLYTDKFVSGEYESREKTSGSIFVQDEWRILQSLSLTSGLRTDWNAVYGSHITPKIALYYKVYPFTIRLNYALGYRSPTLKELYMDWDHLGLFWIFGNADLQPEHNQYASLSTEFISENLYVLVSGYANKFRDKIEGIWSSDQSELHYRNISSTLLAGVNSHIRYQPFKNFYLHTSFNYLHPSVGDGVRLSTQSPFSGHIRAEYGLDIFKKSNINLNLVWSYLSKKSYSVLDEITIDNAIVEAGYTATIPAYSLINFSAGWNYTNRTRLILGVDNLLDYAPGLYNFNTYTGPGRKVFVALYFHF